MRMAAQSPKLSLMKRWGFGLLFSPLAVWALGVAITHLTIQITGVKSDTLTSAIAWTVLTYLITLAPVQVAVGIALLVMAHFKWPKPHFLIF